MSRATSFFSIIAVLLGRPSIATVIAQQSLAEDQAYLRAVAQGYLSNREAFDSLTCRYRVRVGQASSLESALSNPPQNATTAEGVWIVSGRKVRHELVCDPQVIRTFLEKSKGTEILSLPLPSKKFLSNGAFQLQLDPAFRIANIFAPEQPPQGLELTPFDMGVMGPGEALNPGQLIEWSFSGRGYCKLEGSRQFGDVDVISLAFGERRGEVFVRYFLDPHRGFLPIQIWQYSDSSGEPASKVFVTSIRECSNQRWFPERSVVVHNPASTMTSLSVREIIVEALEVDHEPDDGQFVIDVPENTIVNDQSTRDAQVRLQDARQLGLRDLERLLATCRRAALAITEADSVKKTGAWGAKELILGISVAAILFLAVAIYIRKRRPAF